MLVYQGVGPVNKSIFDAPDLTAIPILEWVAKKTPFQWPDAGCHHLGLSIFRSGHNIFRTSQRFRSERPRRGWKVCRAGQFFFWERRICPSMFPYLRESDFLFVGKCREYPNTSLPIWQCLWRTLKDHQNINKPFTVDAMILDREVAFHPSFRKRF